ncbi:MAG TPA: polysaccharide biosynthesis tyrosine autokinase [Verrucomicrobiae bacterium]|nr:polysaccharide biosynthesis tyrosine autokinase [Verrucomicrobiae bacterium]
MDPLKSQPAPDTKLHFLDYWRIIRIRKTVILAVFLLVVITATLVTFILPESYSSMARIKVERDQSDITTLAGQQSLGTYDPYFIQTEFEVIQSEVVLYKVIDALNLNEVWGKRYNAGQRFTSSETMSVLKKQIDLRPVRNTSLIEIRVYSENADEAARIANKIAETYQAYRLETRRKFGNEGIKSLEDRVGEYESRVRQAQSNVDYLRVQLRVPDAVVSSDMPTTLLTAETLRHIEALRIDSLTEYVKQRTLLDRLEKLEPKELTQTIPTIGVQDDQLRSFLESIALVEQKLVSIRKELGPEHTEVLKLVAQEEDLRQKITDRTHGILKGLQAKVESTAEGLSALSNEVARAQDSDVESANKMRPYFEAKHDLEELIRFRQILTTKIAMEKTDLQLPKNSMVEIVDNAKAGLRPVRPNKPLNIALGVVIGLVVGVGLAFFIEYLDTSVKTIDDVERSLGSPVLGVIPQNVGVLLHEGAESPHAEAYRVLRTNLLFSRKDDKLNTVAVVSAGAGEGKSTTVFNLAAVFAQCGQRVIVVDSDLRRPTLHKMLRVTNNIGLTNYLLKQNTLEEVIQTTSLPTLDFMASGKLPSSSLGILSSTQMRDLITELKQHYDFVFFDSPPVMGVSDASILASEVDMTVQVIQYRRYPQPMNIRAKQMIEKVGGNLAGIVLNNINMSQDESYYYYSGYYHEYYSRNEEQAPAPKSQNGAEEKSRLDIKQKY